MRVLHVTECYDGGVGLAINNLVGVSPNHEHHLLYIGRENPALVRGLSSSTKFRQKGLLRIAELKKRVAELEPDVVHAHSSWAGLYTRALSSQVPVVYQPHCFVFEDPSGSRVRSLLARLAEHWLSSKTAVFISLSKHEHDLMTKIDAGVPVVRLPNVSTLMEKFHGSWRSPTFPTVVMSGRVSRQKSPDFFIATAMEVRAKVPDVRFLWIGSGDATLERALMAAGVEVSGWLNGEDLALAISRGTVYFHSADYEGFPLSVLDAAAVGLPVIVRDIPAFEGSGLASVRTVKDAGELIVGALLDPATRELIGSSTQALHLAMTPESQREAVESAYTTAVGNCL